MVLFQRFDLFESTRELILEESWLFDMNLWSCFASDSLQTVTSPLIQYRDTRLIALHGSNLACFWKITENVFSLNQIELKLRSTCFRTKVAFLDLTTLLVDRIWKSDELTNVLRLQLCRFFT